ncbi:MAG: hypothetical protein ACXVEE_28260 [Polyangiales bacterium]
MTFLRLSLLTSIFLAACTAASRSPGVPAGATAIEDESHRSCTCVLLHLTNSASPSRAIDRARIAQMAASNPSLCAYELLADDPGPQSVELRPYLLQAEGAPVDLVFHPGDRVAPAVVNIGNEGQLHAACGGAS